MLLFQFPFLFSRYHSLLCEVEKHLDRVLTVVIARHWVSDQIRVAVGVNKTHSWDANLKQLIIIDIEAKTLPWQNL